MKILADYAGATWDIDLTNSDILPQVAHLVQELFPDRVTRHPPDSYPLIRERTLLEFVDVYGTNSHPLVEAVISNIPTSDFGVRHIYAVRPSSMSDACYIQKKVAFYKSDVVWPSCLADIARSKVSASLPDLTGCHIRYTDNLKDPLKHRFNLNTSLPTFIEKLKLLGERPIILCTDSLEAKKLVMDSVPNGNIFTTDERSGIPPLWQPLFEMLLLAQTQHLIGSQSSTFSYEAAFIGGIDIEVFRDNKWTVYPISQYLSQ